MSILKNPEIEPNTSTMREAAKVLGFELPKRATAEKLVEVLREKFAERLEGVPESNHIVCPNCGEITDDTDLLECCPFCGDEGIPEDAPDPQDTEPTDASELDDDTEEPEEPPVANLDDDPEDDPGEDADAEEDLETDDDDEPEEIEGEVEEPDDDEPEVVEAAEIVPSENAKTMSADMNRQRHIIKKCQRTMVGTVADMAFALQRVHDKALWKVEGLHNFNAFLKSVDLKRSSAYFLIDLASKFDRDIFTRISQNKLREIAKVDDPETRAKLVEDVDNRDMSLTELKKEVKGYLPTLEKEAKKSKAPAKEGALTLLAKVGGAPTSYRFVDRKTRKELDHPTVNSFVEIPISDDVHQLVALKYDDDGEIVGLAVMFQKVAKAKSKHMNGAAKKTTARKSTKKAPAKKSAAKKTTKRKPTKKAAAKKTTTKRKPTKKAAAKKTTKKAAAKKTTKKRGAKRPRATA